MEKHVKLVRDRLSKMCNLNFDKISSIQLSLPAEMGGLGISSTSLAFPAFWPWLLLLVALKYGCFKIWSSTNEYEKHIDGTQKCWASTFTSKPLKIKFLDWMTNFETFHCSSRQSPVSVAERCSFQKLSPEIL